MHKPKLRKLAEKIYCLEFDNAYDLSMTFLRCQEFYESPKFRNKFFTVSDFMEWYSKKYGEGNFTYPTDYVGFNLPSWVILKVMSKLGHEKYDKWTPYDQIMYETGVQILKEQNNDWVFYLIGVTDPKADKVTLRHEIAHGFYTTQPEYKKEIRSLLNQLPKTTRQLMREKLVGRGYAANVFDDETQAYLTTGLHFTMQVNCIKKARKPFKSVFKKYLKALTRGI